MKLPIYLDYAATTPMDPRVAANMQQYLTQDGVFANAASTHALGRIAKDAVEHARAQVAALIHAETSEVIWTSGATEANNLALKGAAQLYQQKGKHIVTVKTEHLSVLDCCQQLEKEGFLVTYLTPDKNGLLDLNQLESVLRDDTILVSVMHVNNETGVIQNLEKIGQLTSRRNILFHVDAVQSAGKIPIDVNHFKIDLMSLSAHKIYGPKGIGALYVRKKPRVRVAAQLHGGGHEHGMRSGTLATHQIVGMGTAFALAAEEIKKDYQAALVLRDLFIKRISENTQVSLVSNPAYCVPNIINIHVKGTKAQRVMDLMPEVCISAGSACGSRGNEPSYVLRALGMSADVAQCCVRVSFGRFTLPEEVIFVCDSLAVILQS
jgi:cysteine desulfurase